MRDAIVDYDFSGRTLDNLEGYYLNCIFNRCKFTGKVNAVLKDCTAEGITFENASIIRLHTPGTALPDVTINKPTLQPLHLAKVIIWEQHNHQYITGIIRKQANEKLRGKFLTTVLRGCDYIDAHPEMSWRDFLFKTEVPKEMWDLAEDFFADYPTLRDFSLNIRRTRWE